MTDNKPTVGRFSTVEAHGRVCRGRLIRPQSVCVFDKWIDSWVCSYCLTVVMRLADDQLAPGSHRAASQEQP